ncbi:clr5 protein [Fusarium sporotrichioides]|uniref:Clr5 protein n=1 Tax=Fusarium sporotrichioides TaxID=5514 RepID=A0A395SLD5_FUSSP|nr:clr5 protein [Fusarium sporotrichioides]
MVYHWEPHRNVCYQLYINERRSLEDIMVHMKNVYQFTPSKRAFQTQFSRWKFPTKQRLKHKDDRLVKRIHELWQKNIPQAEMLRILNEDDGFDINSRELIRVRARNRWLLRVQNGDRARSCDANNDDALENDASLDDEEEGDVTDSLPGQEAAASGQHAIASSLNSIQDDTASATPVPKPSKVSKRQSRRNRQHLGETEGIVRFPSEMTLNESKETLSLNATTYAQIRECFARICQEESIVKKTLAGPGRWDYAKNRLVHERPNLQQVLWLSKENLEKKQLALDIICTDVTKRLRIQDTKMTLLDAKNELGLNPGESHDIRAALHIVLSDANFTCKSDGTPEQWEELKKQWLEKVALLKDIPLDGDDEQSRRKARAIEIVARDVIKRKRDEKRVKAKANETTKPKETEQRNVQNSDLQHAIQEPQLAPERHHSTHRHQVQEDRDPPPAFSSIQQGRASRSSPSPSPAVMDDGGIDSSMDTSGYGALSETTNPYTTRQPAPQNRPVQMQPQTSSMPTPQGTLPQPHRMLGSSATAGVPLNSQYASSMYMGNQPQPNYMEQQYVPHQFASPAPSTIFQPVPAVPSSFAVFLRLHPSSTYVTNTSLWISTMASQSIQELRQTAVAKFPGAMCVRIEGIIKDPKGNELPLQIQGDDELGAYFAHMQGGSPTFSVQLV